MDLILLKSLQSMDNKGNGEPAVEDENRNESKIQKDRSGINTMSDENPLKQILKVWKTLIIILIPIILLPLPILWPTKPGKCAYVVAIMAIYWMTEAIPMAATALIPFALMPWLGIIKASEIATSYLKDTNFLLVGGLFVALAIEKCNLHKRMALRILLLVGSQPRWLLFGFMISTAFLSMWLSNTATTAMMVPIAQAVLMELKANRKGIKDTTHSSSTVDAEKKFEDDAASVIIKSDADYEGFPDDPDGRKATRFHNLCKGLTLSICYSANIGGICTLTGTPPNLVLQGQLDTLFGSDHGINFGNWMAFALPIGVICLFFSWLWLNIMFIGPKSLFGCCCDVDDKAEADVAKTVIRKQYTALGPMTFAEISVLVFFILLALLWLTRDLEFADGWSILFEEGFVSDGCVAVSISVLLFMWPAERPRILCFRQSSDKNPAGPVPSLLDWKFVHRNMSWSVILLLGGGFALADAVKKSGLSAEIGDAFTSFKDFDPLILVLVLTIITAAFTEIASNTASATIFIPILAELAVVLEVNPLYLTLSTAIATSFAFMLPVATPPNAIVFAYGHMKIVDMVKAGFVMNIICIGVLTLGINTWGYAYFDLGVLPDWAKAMNVTNA